MYANIQLPDNLVLDPFLADLVHKLALDMPQYVFSTKGMSKQDINYLTSPSAMQSRETKPPEGTEFLRMVRVHKGSEFLGSLGIDRRYGSRKSEDVYTIKSWRIDNQRGNANTSSTNKLTGAVRIVKKTFIPMNTAEIVGKAESEISSAYVGSLRDLMRPIQHGSLIPNTTVVQRYLYLLLRGDEIPDDLANTMKDVFLSERYEQAMLENSLAEKMRMLPMTTVVQYNNSFLIKRPASDNAFIVAYEELPEKVQSAIGVLQLMQDAELVDNVGYRFNDRYFYVVDKLFNTDQQ